MAAVEVRKAVVGEKVGTKGAEASAATKTEKAAVAMVVEQKGMEAEKGKEESVNDDAGWKRGGMNRKSLECGNDSRGNWRQDSGVLDMSHGRCRANQCVT